MKPKNARRKVIATPKGEVRQSFNAANRELKHKKAMFLQALERNLGVISYAAKEAGIRRQTVYGWIANDPEFAENVRDVENLQGDFVERALFKKINEGDGRCIVFYAATKLRNRGYTNKIELSTPEPIRISGELDVQEVRKEGMGDEALAKAVQAMMGSSPALAAILKDHAD